MSLLAGRMLTRLLIAGEPTGEPKNKVAQVISQAKNFGGQSQYGPGAIAFEFAQARVLAVCCASWPLS